MYTNVQYEIIFDIISSNIVKEIVFDNFLLIAV